MNEVYKYLLLYFSGLPIWTKITVLSFIIHGLVYPVSLISQIISSSDVVFAFDERLGLWLSFWFCLSGYLYTSRFIWHKVLGYRSIIGWYLL